MFIIEFLGGKPSYRTRNQVSNEITKLDISRINRYIERYNDYKVKISKATDEDIDNELIESY